MFVDKFFKFGDESKMEGLTVEYASWDDDYFNSPFDLRNEITEEEYDILLARINDPNEYHNDVGNLLNEEGYREYSNYVAQQEEERRKYILTQEKEIEDKISLVVKKIKKLLLLEIIEEGDVDTEISLNNMGDYAEEIKNRIFNTGNN